MDSVKVEETEAAPLDHTRGLFPLPEVTGDADKPFPEFRTAPKNIRFGLGPWSLLEGIEAENGLVGARQQSKRDRRLAFVDPKLAGVASPRGAHRRPDYSL